MTRPTERIVQILLRDGIGGAETLAETLQEEWTRSGRDVYTVFLDEPGSSSSPVSRMLRLRRILRVTDPGVVIAHSALPNIYARLAARRVVRVFTVLHSANDDFQDPKIRIMERLLLHRTAGVIAVGSLQADQYRARFRSFTNLTTIPNAINRKFRTGTRTPRTPSVIVEAARVVEQKDPAKWLRTAGMLRESHADLEFHWWGPIDENDDLIEGLRLEARRIGVPWPFKGPTADVRPVYEAGDILLHTASREANSIGLLEAAASGICIVCSEAVATTLPDLIPVTTFASDADSGPFEAIEKLILEWPVAAIAAIQAAGPVADAFGAQTCARAYLKIIDQ